MRHLTVVVACVAVFLITACAGRAQAPGGSGGPPSDAMESGARSSREPDSRPTSSSVKPGSPSGRSEAPLCATVPPITAPAEWYRDSPIYVANEMPVEQVRDWAASNPGFETLWVDREHLGWITLAFSVDAEARQAELRERFPDVGAVVVPVDWTMDELEELQRRVIEDLGPGFVSGAGIAVDQGVVSVHVGVLTMERIAAVEQRFAGERICLEGVDPAEVPLSGPQPAGGDGWRLLADEKVGSPYRTWIATDQASYQALWAAIGLKGERPPVDFGAEVVIWFGAVYGSSCPNIRLDDVVVDRDRRLVHARITLLDVGVACTADAAPRAYVVAVERAKLPSGAFVIQLGAGDPAGAGEERTAVDVDLSRPGAVARPGDVHADRVAPNDFMLEPGALMEPDAEYRYRLHVHCGIEWLGRFNDIEWRTDVPDGAVDPVPPQWKSTVWPDQPVEVTLILRAGPRPFIEATANGHTVIYRPTREDPPGCD